MIEVTYLVLETNTRVTKVFYSERPALALKHKLEHSKHCALVSYVIYD